MRSILLLAGVLVLAACSADSRITDPSGGTIVTTRGRMSVNVGGGETDAMSPIVERCEDHVGGFCEGDYGSGTPWDAPIYPACTLDPQSCEFVGGGGGYVANPVPPEPTPDLYDSSVAQDPNCQSTTNVHELAWCVGNLPSPGQRSLINAALARMSLKGGTCAVMAAVGQALLNNNKIRLTPVSANYAWGGAAPVSQGSAGWMLLSDYWTNVAFDIRHPNVRVDSQGVTHTRTLQQLLAHEIDHLRGQGHTDFDGYDTPNANSCSDVP